MILVKKIEESTDYDVLNYSAVNVELINRFTSDDIIHTITIHNKTELEVIRAIKNI